MVTPTILPEESLPMDTIQFQDSECAPSEENLGKNCVFSKCAKPNKT